MEESAAKSGRAKIRAAFVVIFLSIVSSQCFAQSQSQSSGENYSTFQYMSRIRDAFLLVQQNYVEEVDAQVLYEGALKGMLEALGDPYTLYLDPSTMRDLSDTTVGSFGGVGLSISKAFESTPNKPAFVEVVSPIDDTPGARAGIHSGDLITAIDGEATDTMTMQQVLDHLRGPVGSDVVVSIKRGKNVTFDSTLTRAIIEVPTAKYAVIDQVGYVRLIEFTPETAHRLQDALDLFKKSNCSGIVLDLRDNPGGLITSAVDVVDKFISQGAIVSTRSRLKFENSMYSATSDTTTVESGTPVVVLLNHGSASASEIVSGALKDHHVAYLVGQRSYGKGSVQKVVPLSGSDGFKMTIARYYSPSGANIDKKGIPPDMEVLFPKITEEQEKSYTELVQSDEIAKYVESHPGMTEKDIAAYAVTLQKKYPFDLSFLRRLARMEVHRSLGSMVYDLDYDIQLNAALDILRGGNFQSLVASAKTLKELQEEQPEQESEVGSKK